MKIKNKPSIKYKFILNFLTIFIIFSVFTSFSSYFIAYNKLFKEIEDHLLSETIEFYNVFKDGRDKFDIFLKYEMSGEGQNNFFINIFDNNNNEIFSSLKENSNIRKIRDYSSKKHYKMYSAYIDGNNNYFMVIKNKVGDYYFMIGENVSDYFKIFNSLKYILIFTCITGLILVTLIIIFTTNRILVPINKLSKVTDKISLKRDVKIDLEYSDFPLEIYNFADKFEKMLHRIDLLIKETEDISNDIAHDIKTPLTNIKMTAERLLSENSSHSEKDLLGIIHNIDRTTYIIESILSATKIISDKSEMTKEDIDITKCVEDAYELFLDLAESKDIRFRLLKNNESIIIKSNLKAVQRIISNILDNAIKYSKNTTEIIINIKSDKNKTILSVKDTGIGISEEDLPKIFDKFFKADKSRNSSELGIGLGLSIVKSLCDKINARIFVFSSLGKGTEFIIEFPRL